MVIINNGCIYIYIYNGYTGYIIMIIPGWGLNHHPKLKNIRPCLSLASQLQLGKFCNQPLRIVILITCLLSAIPIGDGCNNGEIISNFSYFSIS